MESSIYFATADAFRDDLLKKYDFNQYEELKSKKYYPRVFQKDDEKRVSLTSVSVANDDANKAFKMPDVILDFSAVNYIDTNGIAILEQLIKQFKSKSITVYICNAQGIADFFYFI